MGDVRDNISKNILFYRKKTGLTQSQLAEKLNVKTTSVSSWERGANSPDIETLYSVCQLFNITLDEMYGVEEINPHIQLSQSEQHHIFKYRSIDDKGKHTVNTVLDMEYTRCTKVSNEELLIAAHNNNLENPEELEKVRRDLDKI